MNKFSRTAVSCVTVLALHAAHTLAASASPGSLAAPVARATKTAGAHGNFKRMATAADATVSAAANGRDQADALQAALDALQLGQRLVFSPGQYVVSHSLVVKNQQVVVSGYGATLVATNPDDQAIIMNGKNSTLVGLTLEGTGTVRLQSATSAKVVVSGAGIQVLDVTINGGASAGIFISQAVNIAIAGNKVLSTLADGIHITGRSRNVLVQGNTVTGTGDDMVAVVSYAKDGALSSNVLVTGNSLSGNPWGRGVSVVGGAGVTITGNTVQGVQKAAGVLVGQEDGYRTYNSSNVLISNNAISDIEDAVNPGNDQPPAQHAAVDLNSGSGTVTLVSVTGNQISRANFGGFRALGNVCQFVVSGNTLAAISGGAPISLQSRSCAASQIICNSNTLDGTPLASPAGCSATGTLGISGADATLLPQIRTSLRQTQQTLINSQRTRSRS